MHGPVNVKYLLVWWWIQTARVSNEYYCSLHKVILDSSAVTEKKQETELEIRPDQSEFDFQNRH